MKTKMQYNQNNDGTWTISYRGRSSKAVDTAIKNQVMIMDMQGMPLQISEINALVIANSNGVNAYDVKKSHHNDYGKKSMFD